MRHLSDQQLEKLARASIDHARAFGRTLMGGDKAALSQRARSLRQQADIAGADASIARLDADAAAAADDLAFRTPRVVGQYAAAQKAKDADEAFDIARFRAQKLDQQAKLSKMEFDREAKRVREARQAAAIAALGVPAAAGGARVGRRLRGEEGQN